MSLSDSDTVISALGKGAKHEIIYTQPASKEDQMNILNYFYDLNKEEIENDKLSKYLLVSKKRLSSHSIKNKSF